VIALQVTHLIIRNFIDLNSPLTSAQIAKKLAIPIAIIQSILMKLIASHIIVEFKDQDEYEVYQPAVDINIITIAYVINALEQCGQNHLPDINRKQLFMDIVNKFTKLIENSEQDRLLKEI